MGSRLSGCMYGKSCTFYYWRVEQNDTDHQRNAFYLPKNYPTTVADHKYSKPYWAIQKHRWTKNGTSYANVLFSYTNWITRTCNIDEKENSAFCIHNFRSELSLFFNQYIKCRFILSIFQQKTNFLQPSQYQISNSQCLSIIPHESFNVFDPHFKSVKTSKKVFHKKLEIQSVESMISTVSLSSSFTQCPAVFCK